MDEITQLTPMQPHTGALKKARQDAARALRSKDALVVLALAYLFCATALFVLCFLVTALAFFLMPQEPYAMLAFTLSELAAAAFVFFALLLPLFAGRLRMTGLAAAGREIALCNLFYYFGAGRLWGRGVRIALLCPLALLPPFFAFPALGIGNEELSLRRALALSVSRVRLVGVLGFWGHLLVRLVLGLCTLGLLWLLYDAHHLPVSYFALAMQEKTE